MQLKLPNPCNLDKFSIGKKHKNITMTQRERNFETSPTSKSVAYNALEDKFAFGYFQSRSVQRHLKKLLKNAKHLPPSAETRRVITSLSEKITHSQQKATAIAPSGAQRAQRNESVNNKRVKTETREDVYYPYKEELKLQSLQKVRRNIERKQKQLRLAQEKEGGFPRLNLFRNDVSHEKVMQKLIVQQDRKLAQKIKVVNKLNHSQFIKYLTKRAKASSLTTSSNNVQQCA